MINVTKTKLPPLEIYTKCLEKIWKSNWVTNDGQFSRLLQTKLESFLKVRNLILVANGTLALTLAIRALKLRGEIITTPFTFPATTNAIIWEGLKPVFVDIDPKSFNIDPVEVEKKITKKTSAILAVHVFGNPCNVEVLSEIARRYKLKLIYDAAHSFGIEYKDQSILKWGDISTLSFHAAKTFHTIEGGAVITKLKKDSSVIKLMSTHGIKTYERIVLPGINARINEFESCMGLLLLKEYNQDITKRKKLYELYSAYFKGRSQFRLQELNSGLTKYTYPYFPVCFKSEKVLKRVYSELHNNNIHARRYFYPSTHELPYITKKEKLKNAENISRTVLCLPLYADLDLKSLKKIIDIIDANAR